MKPNILLILADDLGFSDLGCYGGEIQTPNLDAVAENGLRYSQFYNTARCWPTRSALLTGYYAQQIRRDTLPGIPSGGGGVRPAWAKLLPELLRPAGYRSYHIGKWHIDGMPVEGGFDRSYYLRDQGRFFNPTRHWLDDQPLPAVEKGTDFYATSALADRAITMLKEHEKEHSNAPFFQYVAFAAPHFPLHALPQDIEHYRDSYTSGWDEIRSQRWHRMRQLGLLDATMVSRPSQIERRLGPPYHFPDAFEVLGPGEVNKPLPWKSLNAEQKAFQATKMSLHAAMVHRMDIEIGRIFEQIKKMGQWENTLIVFLSDNGASAEIMVRDDGHDPNANPGSAATYLCLGPGWSTVCNTPFRRHKTWTHEGGISTPLIVSWPAGIRAAGEFRRTPGHVVDITPTLLELAGAETLANAPDAPGTSLTPTFRQESELPSERTLWWFHDGNKAIRRGNWKAIAPIGEPWELYDLSHDRVETTDLAVPQHERLQSLTKEWERMTNEFEQLASKDLSTQQLERAKNQRSPSVAMSKAQAAGKPNRRQVLINGESMLVNGRHAFLMRPDSQSQLQTTKPWIFYAPALNAYPDQHESWMHQKFLDAGVAVAGIDVGEAFGSPHAFRHFEALYQEMKQRGYSERPALLGRSRGGLWVSSWAIERPDCVAGIGGIYPVFDYLTYPGAKRASTAYGQTDDELVERQADFNPIQRADRLAQAQIPVFIIHGTEDQVVPIAQNSAALERSYEQNSASELLQLLRVPNQGHNFWPGFFQCEELIDFLIVRAQEGAGQ